MTFEMRLYVEIQISAYTCLQLTDVRLRTFDFLVEPHSSDGTRSLVPMKHNIEIMQPV